MRRYVQAQELSRLPLLQRAEVLDVLYVGYGLAVLALVFASYLIGAFGWLPHDPRAIDVALINAAPFTPGHLLGTDFLGRDLQARLILGIQAYFLPGLLAIGALLLVLFRVRAGERRAAGIPLAIAAATVAVPLAIALATPGKDFVLARNLLPALVPLLVAVAVGCTLPAARRIGAVLGVALVAYSLGFSAWASLSPALQRPDWDAVATTLGEPTTPRAMVTWTIGEASLRYYLSTGSFQARPSEGFAWWVGEVDFVSEGEAPPPPRRLLGLGFRQTAFEQVGRLWVRRYERAVPGLAPLRLRALRRARLGFRSNGALLDGIGPG